MEKLEGYKKTKIGWMPDDWETKTLGTIGEFLKGKGIAKKDLIEDGVPCVRYGEIYTVHHWVLKKFYSFISSETASQSTQIQKGDILFAGSGETVEEIGKAVAYLHEDEAYAGGDTIILRPGKAHSAFLSACLDIETSNMQKRKLGQGNSVVHIYPAGLKKLMVPFPPLPEQKKIAYILTTVDDKISSIDQQIQQTEQLKKGLMEKLLTEGIGHTEFKETKIGRIPKGWGFSTIEKACCIHNNLRKPISADDRKTMSGEYPYYGPTRIVDYINEYRVEGEYALIGEDGDHFLKYKTHSMTQLASGKFNVNNHAHIIEGKGECSTKWVYHFYKHRNIIQFLTRQGAGRYKLNKASLLRMPIAIPSAKEQGDIINILSAADDKIDILNQKKAQYQTLKKGLSQQLLTGQMRVKI